jgi:hypothetical protein
MMAVHENGDEVIEVIMMVMMRTRMRITRTITAITDWQTLCCCSHSYAVHCSIITLALFSRYVVTRGIFLGVLTVVVPSVEVNQS